MAALAALQTPPARTGDCNWAHGRIDGTRRLIYRGQPF
jgi:hypothetical protein